MGEFAVTYCQRRPHDLYHLTDRPRMISGRTQPLVVSVGNGRTDEEAVDTMQALLNVRFVVPLVFRCADPHSAEAS